MSDAIVIGAAVVGGILSLLSFSAWRRTASAAELATQALMRINDREARQLNECPGCAAPREQGAPKCARCGRAA